MYSNLFCVSYHDDNFLFSIQGACFPEQVTQFDFLGRIDSLRLEFSEKVSVTYPN